MARRPHTSNESLTELFLDMLAAERGASANTLDAYRRDLADFSADLNRTGGSIATADSDALPSRTARQARACGGDGGAAALRDPPTLPLPLQRGSSRRRSGRGDRGAEA